MQGSYVGTHSSTESQEPVREKQVRRKWKMERNQESEEDDDYEPEYHTMKKLKLPINRDRLSKGNWNRAENITYIAFLKKNVAHFANETTRREERIFCRLSEELRKRRTPDQCRSHHQKLISRHGNSITQLIAWLQSNVNNKKQHQSGLSRRIRNLFKIVPAEEQVQIAPAPNAGAAQAGQAFFRSSACHLSQGDNFHWFHAPFTPPCTTPSTKRFRLQIPIAQMGSY